MNDKFHAFKFSASNHIAQNVNMQSSYIFYILIILLIVIIIYLIVPNSSKNKKNKEKKSKTFLNFYDFNVWILKKLDYKKKKPLMVQLISQGIFDLIQILEWESFELLSKSLKGNELKDFLYIIATRKVNFIKKLRSTNHLKLRKLINEMRVFTLDEKTILLLASPKDQDKFLSMIKSLSKGHTQVFDLKKTGDLIKTLRGTFLKVVFL
ncbi:MAG: hypothetical protein COB02_01780 [Candidatus Cloacimonadota bacterium]|nr:MAG: hypothetical protein COB02_01780 [Candidatus Cloacimonadota bacterium]